MIEQLQNSRRYSRNSRYVGTAVTNTAVTFR